MFLINKCFIIDYKCLLIYVSFEIIYNNIKNKKLFIFYLDEGIKISLVIIEKCCK